jgi:hypothetical protein
VFYAPSSEEGHYIDDCFAPIISRTIGGVRGGTLPIDDLCKRYFRAIMIDGGDI